MTRPVVGIAVFPGTNCERETARAFASHGVPVRYLWHEEPVPEEVDWVVLPGGFSYGDYLRAGAIARLSPLVRSLQTFVKDPRKVVFGICNGFQILTEAHLLPGALTWNHTGVFLCRVVEVEVVSHHPLLRGLAPGEVLRLPVAHSEGRFVADGETLRRLSEKDGILFRYTEDINGSTERIAGVAATEGNVIGMMPHPERAVHPLISTDGARLLGLMLQNWREHHGTRGTEGSPQAAA